MMTAEEIIALIDTKVAGLEERLELQEELKDEIKQISITAKQSALMELRIAILNEMEARK